MKRKALVIAGSSTVLGVFLILALALPAAAQPWAGNMWGNHQNDAMHEQCDAETMGKMHEAMHQDGSIDEMHARMSGMHGQMHQMHEGCDGDMMGEMHGSMGSGMMNGMHNRMHRDGSMDEMHGRMGSGMMNRFGNR
jgi:hypothetical protein